MIDITIHYYSYYCINIIIINGPFVAPIPGIWLLQVECLG